MQECNLRLSDDQFIKFCDWLDSISPKIPVNRISIRALNRAEKTLSKIYDNFLKNSKDQTNIQNFYVLTSSVRKNLEEIVANSKPKQKIN